MLRILCVGWHFSTRVQQAEKQSRWIVHVVRDTARATQAGLVLLEHVATWPRANVVSASGSRA